MFGDHSGRPERIARKEPGDFPFVVDPLLFGQNLKLTLQDDHQFVEHFPLFDQHVKLRVFADFRHLGHLLQLGARDEQVTVLRNGVDLELFRPAQDRGALRKRLGIEGHTLISAGHLIERKGHHLAIEAMRDLPDWQLLLVGDGPQEKALRAQVRSLQLEARVSFIGRVDQEQLRDYYSASDALVLASSREGWANVLLEAMACGTPVVASPVDGTPEVVAQPAAGVLMADRSATSVVTALKTLQAAMPQRVDTRAYAEQFDWDATSQGQLDIFERAVAGYRARG